MIQNENDDRDNKDLSPKSAILSSSVASFMSFPLPQKISSLMMQTYLNFAILSHHSLVLSIAVAWSLALSPVDFVLLPQSAMQAIPKLNVKAEVDMEILVVVVMEDTVWLPGLPPQRLEFSYLIKQVRGYLSSNCLP